MITTVPEIKSTLIQLLKNHCPPLRIRKEEDTSFEVCGTKERMQGKQMVDGFYFASIVPKPKDVRLYFFPIYTHVEQFTNIPGNLRKCLKGKSCFHIKKLDSELTKAIKEMISTGVAIYSVEDLI